jgi:hypothetical protein
MIVDLIAFLLLTQRLKNRRIKRLSSIDNLVECTHITGSFVCRNHDFDRKLGS